MMPASITEDPAPARKKLDLEGATPMVPTVMLPGDASSPPLSQKLLQEDPDFFGTQQIAGLNATIASQFTAITQLKNQLNSLLK